MIASPLVVEQRQLRSIDDASTVPRPEFFSIASTLVLMVKAAISVLVVLVSSNALGYQDAPTSESAAGPPPVSASVESRTSYFDKPRNVHFVVESLPEVFGGFNSSLYVVTPDGNRTLLKSSTSEQWNEVIARDFGVVLLAETKLYILDAQTGAEKNQMPAAPDLCLIGESFQNTTFSVWTGKYSTVYDQNLNALAQNEGGGCFNTGYAGGGLTAWDVPIEFPKQTRLTRNYAPPIYLGGWKVFVPEARGFSEDIPAHVDDYSRPTYFGEVLSGPYPNALPIVEYYNSQAHDYVLTINPEEQAFLDADPLGWGYRRTSYYFWGWQRLEDAPPTATEVCRFYSPIYRTHFYTFVGFECDLLDQDPGTWIHEGANRFFLLPGTKPPDFDGPYSTCPLGSLPIYRYWNGGVMGSPVGTAHRYVQQNDYGPASVVQDWIFEGARFCAPS